MTSHVMSCPLIARWTPIQFPPFQSVLYWAASTATQYHIPDRKAIPIPEQAGLSPNSPFHPQSGARPRSGRARQPSPSLALCFVRLLGRRPGPFLGEIVGCEAGLPPSGSFTSLPGLRWPRRRFPWCLHTGRKESSDAHAHAARSSSCSIRFLARRAYSSVTSMPVAV